MSTPDDVVFLFDVDNTLLDNDHVISDLRSHLTEAFGAACSDRYWQLFEALRSELGYADYLGALQRYRGENESDTRLLQMSAFLINYPFPERVYPGAFDAIGYAREAGPTVIVSDGDVVFQPRKIERAGLWKAFDGRVMIFIHKERMLRAIEAAYPARHYVMIDDKLRILTAMKEQWGDRLTTVFVRQGHYAHDTEAIADFPAADLTIETIAELKDVPMAALLG
ncbi:HAD family hydrolase [Paraburkholderia sp.]|uniref:HAD family hydrolase n=1 Tax=Paraburkholderia sp. TaxID=1926495 RepID=UPI0023A5ADD7|nr:HAD family hydrolase [Paraburkholderia sp.]MDE1181007.1 HAD family hydrolase [Paraburkholderia sp.]